MAQWVGAPYISHIPWRYLYGFTGFVEIYVQINCDSRDSCQLVREHTLLIKVLGIAAM